VKGPPVSKKEPEKAGTDSFKDSCLHALDLIKQFLTYSAAGIAFVVGIVYSDKPGRLPAWAVALNLLFLGLSIAAGWLCFMRIIGKINRERSYDVYDRSVQLFSIGQILFFGLGILCLGWTTLQWACQSSATPAKQVVPGTPSAIASPSSTH
jgi:hypothetical protein